MTFGFKLFFEETVNAYVFDVDMTLLDSGARVWIYKDGLKDHAVSAQDYTTYKLKSGEELKNPESFREFDEISLDRVKPLAYASNVFKNIYQKYKSLGEEPPIYILTARRQEAVPSIIAAIKKLFNADIDPKKIYTVGDVNPHDLRDVPTKKRDVLLQLRQKHHGRLEFWDDDHANLQMAKTVRVGDKSIRTRLAKA